ncbi:MAG: class I mannose-6-phosphate isomerase [Planctomycetes bacterium]|nr:class I mannose-6-phosphate isomerase [Planctomycetota bacterium]
MNMYPLKSVPVFKERIWGGRKLQEVFGKDLPPGEKIGESWEIADLPEGQSTIGNGALCGQPLGAVVRRYPGDIAGTRDFPPRFPLLVKFLDAQDVLSVQVHPDPQTCRRMGRGDPKTECWYIIRAEPGAVIYKGLRQGVTKERFAQAIADGTTADLLAMVPVQPGECHFIPAGTAHSLGAGLLIAEVQTPSDTTYRVFDWNRVDDTGHPRSLHIAEALESIHFDVTPDTLPVTTVGRLVDCEYFRLDKGHQAAGGERWLARGCGRVLIFLTGRGTILSRQAEPVDFRAGDCLVIPAVFEGAMRCAHDTEYLTVTI